MKIKMVVQEVEKNPNYKAQADVHHHYDSRSEDERWFERTTTRLEVELTEDEWKAIKKAVLEVM